MPRCLQSNPPWLSAAIADSYQELEDQVPPAWLPRLEDVHASRGGIRADVEELGCGSYGCVLPTLTAGVVLKVTTDGTEAEFAHKKANKLVAPIAVHYYMIVRLSKKHDGRRIWLLWRESAESVGKIGKVSKESEKAVNDAYELGAEAYRVLFEHEPDSAVRHAVRRWLDFLEMHTADKHVGALFAGMAKVSREQGVLLGDVHSGNLGLVDGVWKIIDPGNVGALTPSQL